jgi:hypothetical protein
MAKRDNHYEAAFEAWLRASRVPYVAVDEAHRALRGANSLKSLDFIISAGSASNPRAAAPARWLIDVKGRQFPTAGTQYWRNWSTSDELESLAGWESLFGQSATAMLVFAYNVIGDLAPLPADELFIHRRRLYGFVGVRLDHYASFARTLSVRWGTVTVPAAQFRALARPARELLGIPLPARAMTCS